MTEVRAKDPKACILNLVALLSEVQATPQLFAANEGLCAALNSQGALACYADEARCIDGVALNTQRKYANEVLAGGFQSLDGARKQAIAAIQRFRSATVAPGGNTKAALLASARALEEDNLRLEGDLLVLNDMLDRSMRHGRLYAEAAGPLMQDRCLKEQTEILALLGPRAKPRLKSVT